MVDVISVVFLMFGLISVFKPEWGGRSPSAAESRWNDPPAT